MHAGRKKALREQEGRKKQEGKIRLTPRARYRSPHFSPGAS
jgi:hypothetical protein